MSRCQSCKFLLIALLLCLSAISARAQSFTELTDIPFMDGMVESTDDWMQFDSPEGHILQTRAKIKGKSKTDVIDFYRETLPAVGWMYDKDSGCFTRDEDVLTVSFERNGDDFFALFEIKTK